jgi:L-fuconolactonase
METTDTEFEILDSQIIFNAPEALPDLALSDVDRDVAAVELALLAMSSVGVDGALWHANFSLCETAVTRHPDRFRGIVYFPEPDGSDVEQELARVHETPGMAGIRLTPAWPPSGENIARFEAGAYDPWLKEAERLGLVVSFFMWGHLPRVGPVAEAYASLKLVIDHVGMLPAPHVPLAPERLDAIPDLLALAKYENVAVKFSGVPALSYERYPFADLWPASHQMIDAFGPERLMWGSDFRRLRTLHSYGEVVDFLKLTDEVSAADKKLMFSESLRNWMSWPRE